MPAEHGKGGARPNDACEGLGSKVAQIEQVSDEAASRFGNDHRSRLGRTGGDTWQPVAHS